MATAEKSPKRSGLGLVTKLALWAVVIAFGYLYLSSVDRGSGNVSTSSSTQPGGSDSALAAAPEAGGSVFEQVVDTLGELPGMVVDLAGSAGELATAAKPYVVDAASATMDGAKFVVAQVKDLAGLTSASDEPAATDAGSAQTASVASGGETPPAGSVTTETAPAEAAMVEATAAGSSIVTNETEAAPAVAESSSAGPATVAPAVSAERPQSPGFDRHFAPIRTAPPAAPSAEPAAAATATASTAEPAKTVPVSEAEATVFAESLMRPEATPPAASGQVPAVPATSDQAGTMAAAAPAASLGTPGMPPAAPPIPAPPASFGPVPPVSTMAMPEPIQPAPSSVPAAEPPVDVFAQERARRQADYEAMRRAAEQRARAYWEQRPVAPPIGAYPGGYAPPFGAGPYAPGYVPAPYPYAR